MVPTARVRASVALVAGSVDVEGFIGLATLVAFDQTVMYCVVWPGAKVSVPLAEL